MKRRFHQVDVFTDTLGRGNPLAVVVDGEGLADADMQAFAGWTNLSETTFLLPPTVAGADYRVRIFTTTTELPFAGHPTLGTCRVWLDIGGVPANAVEVVQECAAGLVRIRRHSPRLAFAAPPLLRSGPADAELVGRIEDVLGTEVVDAAWCDNGPGWVAALLPSAEDVLAVTPDFASAGDLKLGLVAPYADPAAAGADFEVRAFFPGVGGVFEDPVTGSLNAALAAWLFERHPQLGKYVASQGTVLGRCGRVHVERDPDGTIWVGGHVVEGIIGTVAI